MKYLNDWRKFVGKLLTEETIDSLPDCLEKEHIIQVRNKLLSEGFNPDEFRVCELPIQDVYYFEKSTEEPGIDYFGINFRSGQDFTPIYTTIQCDENGINTFDCKTIKESIELTEC